MIWLLLSALLLNPVDLVREGLVKHLKERFPYCQKIELEDLRLSSMPSLSPGQVDLTILENSQDLLGKASFTVILRQGEKEERLVASAKVKIWAQVPFTTRRIEKHRLITAEDFVLREVELSTFPRGVITDPKLLLNKRVKNSLPPGIPLRLDHLEEPPVLKKGDLANALLETPSLRISVKVVLLEDGRIGEIVRVKNPISNKELKGRVMDEKTLLIGGF
jgi:flagella basal body P-ring formation protein FlgA